MPVFRNYAGLRTLLHALGLGLAGRAAGDLRNLVVYRIGGVPAQPGSTGRLCVLEATIYGVDVRLGDNVFVGTVSSCIKIGMVVRSKWEKCAYLR